MIIKKYSLYKESNSNPSLEKFAIDLYHVSGKFGHKESLYGNSLARTNRDPNSDLNLFKQRMLTKGWDNSSIIELFKAEEDVTRYVDVYELDEDADVNRIDQMNGIVDLYLIYCQSLTGTTDKYNFVYGGMGQADDDIVVNEAIIRYEYGCHKTKYGKLANSVTFKSVEQYKSLVFQNVDELFYWKRIPMLDGIEDDTISLLKQFITKDEDELTLNINMKGVYSELQHDSAIDTDIEYEDFVEECITYFSEIFDDCEYIRTDLKLKV